MLFGRRPRGRPPEPLHGEVESAGSETDGQVVVAEPASAGVHIRELEPRPFVVTPPPGRQGRKIEQRRPDARHLPVDWTDARPVLGRRDDDVGRVKLAVHERPGEGDERCDDVVVPRGYAGEDIAADERDGALEPAGEEIGVVREEMRRRESRRLLMEPREPARDLFPRLDLADLPELDAGDLLDEEPETSPLAIHERPVVGRRSEPTDRKSVV